MVIMLQAHPEVISHHLAMENVKTETLWWKMLWGHIFVGKTARKILRERVSPHLKLIEKPNAMSQRYNNSFHLGPDLSL